MEPMIRATMLHGYFQVARRHGLSPLALLREVGLDADVLVHPEHRMSAAAGCRLLEISAERAGCPTFALEMAAGRQAQDVGAVGLLLANRRTLRDALLTAVHYRHVLNDALGIYLEFEGDMVAIRAEVISDAPRQTRQATELGLAVLARIGAALLGPQWEPHSVNFTHAAPADTGPHVSFFGCPVKFDSEINGIFCKAALLDLPNPTADVELARYAEDLVIPLDDAVPESVALEVRKILTFLLPLGQASISDVAEALHKSRRTLQRQLQAEGLDYVSLLDEVRYDHVVQHLAHTRHSIGRVAELLGFSRQASFTRWFVERFGMTPRAWRARPEASEGQR
ncbi:AraC family transcriptional regulator [Paraburkholderia sp. HD33-4]|uniref:AraC family transcriptional regulator n=1 Tax=Paraburkholderia sp. HD33-4 TaxID=2883242 RepID=UPI001F25C270|nr:AraC family transcriptional regulator [Paraburkholderia sp. HD33-4]